MRREKLIVNVSEIEGQDSGARALRVLLSRGTAGLWISHSCQRQAGVSRHSRGTAAQSIGVAPKLMSGLVTADLLI